MAWTESPKIHLFLSAVAVNSHRAIIVSVLLGFAPFWAGCGRGDGPDRLPLHGTVTLPNGEKPSGYSISFLPVKGQPGPSATTKLTDGSYQFDRSNGPTKGPHEVTVKKISSKSRIPSASSERTISKAEPFLPESVNVSDDGRYLHDFTLRLKQ